MGNGAGLQEFLNFKKCTCCIDRSLWLSASHIPGKGNIFTDYEWRLLNENLEWNLFSAIFEKPQTHFTSKTHY